MTRFHRVALLLASSLVTTAAHAQVVCSESNRCFNTIGSPGRYASIGSHRMLFANGEGAQHVQMLVASPNAVIQGFAVSPLVVAYALRRIGEQPEVRVVEWSNGQSRTYPTALTAEHIVVDATNVYWIDTGYLIRASIATGAKTVGPRIANNVTRMQVDHGIVYVATDHEVMRLDSAGTSWTTIAGESADDLVVDGHDVYWASSSRGS